MLNRTAPMCMRRAGEPRLRTGLSAWTTSFITGTATKPCTTSMGDVHGLQADPARRLEELLT